MLVDSLSPLGLKREVTTKTNERERTAGRVRRGRKAHRADVPSVGGSRRNLYTVSTIAYDAEFGDLSYFNRSFRRVYGLAPRDISEAAAAPTG